MIYSIIIPTYNSEQWIKSCVNSVLAQTFTDFNIIVIDSGSTDGTLPWLESLNDERIVIHATAKRLGIEDNWARITSLVKNEFMTILGHDDILFPGFLATIELLRKQHPAASLYQTHFNCIDESGNTIRHCRPMKEKYEPADFIQIVLESSIDIAATGFVMRSKLYDDLGGIPPYNKLLFADIELWIKIIENSYLAVSAAECFSFRFHSNNTSKTFDGTRLAGFERLSIFIAGIAKTQPVYWVLLKKYGTAFVTNFTVGTCNKLLYIPHKNRGDLTMQDVIDAGKKSAAILLPGYNFRPENLFAMKMAKLIDRNSILRGLFIFYKSFSKRTY